MGLLDDLQRTLLAAEHREHYHRTKLKALEESSAYHRGELAKAEEMVQRARRAYEECSAPELRPTTIQQGVA